MDDTWGTVRKAENRVNWQDGWGVHVDEEQSLMQYCLLITEILAVSSFKIEFVKLYILIGFIKKKKKTIL